AAAQAALLRAAGLSALAARRKARPIHEDQALREALALTPGGIGVSDEGSSAFYGSPLWRLPIKGLSPALYIRLLLSPDPPPRLRRFAAFIQGAEARRVITELGYTP
ncbi:hypothetical protein KJ940_09695, partial [Myxococcota bacterium]|nr:hypothetical protein [Myxococcota bacterium]